MFRTEEKSSVLLITPPFTQFNCPYPATSYLIGYLKEKKVQAFQADLGLETFLSIFSKDGLTQLFEAGVQGIEERSENSQRIFYLKESYIETITPVIQFLQGGDPTLANRICNDAYLPEASRFDAVSDLELSFGIMGILDRAKYLATLYIDDLSDFIAEVIDPDFGFSKYAERIALSANLFEPIEKRLRKEESYIDRQMVQLLKNYIQETNPKLIGFSVPFPGNLYCALKCGQYIKQYYPNIKVVLGGGYPSTELRELKSSKIFEYCDYVVVDDGETALLSIIKVMNGELEEKSLYKTYYYDGEIVHYHDDPSKNICTADYTPDYSGLKLDQYLSLIEVTNPMHRLWSDGRWNKLTLAKGCYWARCTFCDTSLPYIRDFHPYYASDLVDRMEKIIQQTGHSGFHFVDEAAPPELLQELSLEILKRGLSVTWWTNVRFEKRFSGDLCRLMAEAGCIAVTGGLEVASDRLLKLIKKGVTVEQASQVAANFTESGIMVHAYLMYGFPTQTARETINSLEVVRQMFSAGILQSAFWHQFSMTAHSPVGKNPSEYQVSQVGPKKGDFAWNDLLHKDLTGAKHQKFGEGLKKALYNYMHGVGLDYQTEFWFEFKTPAINISPKIVENALGKQDKILQNIKEKNICWMGGVAVVQGRDKKHDKRSRVELKIYDKSETVSLKVKKDIAEWLVQFLNKVSVKNGTGIPYQEIDKSFQDLFGDSIYPLLMGKIGQKLQDHGLIFLKVKSKTSNGNL